MKEQQEKSQQSREGARQKIKVKTSLANILNTVSDDKALDLFKTIAFEDGDRNVLRRRTQLTRKQYYSKIAALTKVGLIERKRGKHFLTTIGRVVYNTILLMEIAVKDYWKLKAIDSFRSNDFSQQDYSNIVNTLIGSNKIKDIIFSNNL